MDSMETKLKRSTYASLILSVLFLLIVLVHFFVERDIYRKELGVLVWYIAYPALFLSIALSTFGIYRIKGSNFNQLFKRKYLYLNFFSIVVFLIFLLRFIWAIL